MVKHHRTTDDDLDRIRAATMPGHYTDALVGKTMNAYTAMARGELKADRVDTVAPAGETWERNTPAAVSAALERSRIGPAALSHPCSTCGAEAGVWCSAIARGLCGGRVHVALRTLGLAITNMEMTR